MPLEQDDDLRQLLLDVERIAVVGIKAGAEDDAYRVPAYMRAQGYAIQPISPKLDRVFDTPCVPSLGDLVEPTDLVNLFRAPMHVPAHVDEVLALPTPPRAVWMQLGIRHDEAAARLEARGIQVVQDRCLLVEHRRLLTSGRAERTR